MNSTLYNKDINYLKRLFFLLSIFFASFFTIKAQNYNFSNLYSEKMMFNPAYSGLSKLSEFTLNYSKNFFSDKYAASFNKYIPKYNTGIGIFAYNNRLGKNAINNYNISIIYSYRVEINHKSLINTALQASYFQQSVNAENLIFSNQINPITQTIQPNTSEFNFQPYKTPDFSFGTAYVSNKYRTGISLHHGDKLFIKTEKKQLKPKLTIHFGKVFSVMFSDKAKKILLTPELIWQTQNNFHQIIYAIHGIYNKFLTRFYLKHNLNFNSFEGIVGIGLRTKKLSISYTYSMTFTKHISMPTSTQGVRLQYSFGKQKKINSQNTIYCLNF